MTTANFITAMKYSLTACSAAAVVENLLVIAVLAGTKSLRIKYYGFVFNLALSDLGFAALEIAYLWGSTGSRVLFAVLTACSSVSALTVLAVAVNRYLALSLMPPARYDALVTRRRLIGACFLLWCFSLLVKILFVCVASGEVRITALGLVTPLLVIAIWVVTVLFYFLLFRKIKQYAPPLSATTPGVNPAPRPGEVSTRVRQTRRLLVTFTLILVTSFICWSPYCVVETMRYFDRSLYFDANFTAYYWAAALAYCLSAVINPLIYWGRLDGFREGFYAIVCRCVVNTQSKETEVENTNEETVAEAGL